MDEPIRRLLVNVIRTERTRMAAPAAKALAAIRDKFTRANALGHGRYPVLLDEASAAEYEARAEEWLTGVRRVFDETRTPWTASGAQDSHQLIQEELATDWDEILDRLRRMLPPPGRIRIDQLDSAKSRVRDHLEQELALLVLKADRTRVPLSDRLSAPRYWAVNEAWTKAHSYLNGQPQDLANSAKEAVGAVEALARLVVGDATATLGDAVRALRSSGRVQAPLLKGIEEIWSWASREPGVRHGAVEGELEVADVRYVITLAEGAISLLLARDDLTGARG